MTPIVEALQLIFLNLVETSWIWIESSFFKKFKSEENSKNDFVSLIDLGSSISLEIGEIMIPKSSDLIASPFLPNLDFIQVSSFCT